MRILIVEDEIALAEGLEFNFQQEGYQVDLAGDGQTALALLPEASPAIDLVILDLMLPGLSGYDTCRAIRSTSNELPILVLSARTLSEDKAQAFDAGADQYMTKPFALPELLSRVRNLLERHGRRTSTPQESLFRFGRVEVDFSSFQVSIGDQKHDLTKTEIELLRYFVEHEGTVLTRAEILRDVWDDPDEITTRSIDNFVMRLRRIIEPDPSTPRHLLSVRGSGYRFVAAPDSPPVESTV
ncbi:MAG: response regulator transcription factor [Planctomycetaceae bacterium]|jgi:two-component system OmpR family response regulator|nr:response regulator transcription factor [Planctomycetaceae bacterium]